MESDCQRRAAQRGPPSCLNVALRWFSVVFEGANGARHGVCLRQYRGLTA